MAQIPNGYIFFSNQALQTEGGDRLRFVMPKRTNQGGAERRYVALRYVGANLSRLVDFHGRALTFRGIALSLGQVDMERVIGDEGRRGQRDGDTHQHDADKGGTVMQSKPFLSMLVLPQVSSSSLVHRKSRL